MQTYLRLKWIDTIFIWIHVVRDNQIHFLQHKNSIGGQPLTFPYAHQIECTQKPKNTKTTFPFP